MFRTAAAKKPGPPSSVFVNASMPVSGDYVCMAWDAPADNGGAQIVGYTIYMLSYIYGDVADCIPAVAVSDTCTVVADRPTNAATSYCAEHLNISTAYVFAVRAWNAAGHGGQASAVSVLTTADLPTALGRRHTCRLSALRVAALSFRGPHRFRTGARI